MAAAPLHLPPAATCPRHLPEWQRPRASLFCQQGTPDVPVERIDTIGNASLGGTSLLVQADYSEAIEALCNSCKIVELNQVPSFSDHYTDSLLLEEIE